MLFNVLWTIVLLFVGMNFIHGLLESIVFLVLMSLAWMAWANAQG